ncbi:hypothetical protein JAAARDRAFT_59402 [Jaapia argillacea MUCL 33604]|uniref:DUF7729 domain-containing protein n=1 Tax=Jaapia argillacea MUCL 33604 TaxID=933084 RepID=A0A067PMC0_9AGAM|nr:hypothetical protein JAAARDRAFT_59402 [Jaapia argillacea MUCL 33604]
MKSITLISLFATTAFAASASSSSATPTSAASASIPTGISEGCSAFLTSLNSDPALYACTAPLIAATSAFGPGGKSANVSSTQITAALTSLCTTNNTSCPDTTVTGKLADFYSNCTAELTSSPNDEVIQTYDILYALTPLKTAVCSKDDTGRFCVINPGGTSSSSAAPSASAGAVNAAAAPSTGPDLSGIQNYLWSSSGAKKRDVSYTPNITTYHDYNVVFLFLSTSMPSTTLCVSCTREVLTAYINFESTVPYAPGITKSPLMSGQSALYTYVQNTCGKSFMSGAVAAAGGISGGVLGGESGAGRNVNVEGGALTMIMGVIGVVAAGFAASL